MHNHFLINFVVVSDLLCLDTTGKISRKLHRRCIERLLFLRYQTLKSTVRFAIGPLVLMPWVFVWLLERRNLQISLSAFSKRLTNDYFKGRNFRGKELLWFCGFWPIPRKFVSTKLFKVGHTRSLTSIIFFKICYMRKVIYESAQSFKIFK